MHFSTIPYFPRTMWNKIDFSIFEQGTYQTDFIKQFEDNEDYGNGGGSETFFTLTLKIIRLYILSELPDTTMNRDTTIN